MGSWWVGVTMGWCDGGLRDEKTRTQKTMGRVVMFLAEIEQLLPPLVGTSLKKLMVN